MSEASVDPQRPETWPMEPPKADGYYWCVPSIFPVPPEIVRVTRLRPIDTRTGQRVEWNYWLAMRPGRDLSEFGEMHGPFSRCDDWRWLPSQLTPAAPAPASCEAMAEAVLRETEPHIFDREVCSERECQSRVNEIAAILRAAGGKAT